MNIRPPSPCSPIVLSVRVKRKEAQQVFVVTQNPAFSDAVRGFIHQTNETIAVVWLTSLAEARRRLAWNSPSMVVVDNFSGNAAPEDAVADIQAASPHSRILVLIEDAVRS